MATSFRASFIGGEISPKLAARVDIQSYQHSCLQLQNFLLLPGGGVERVPGTKYVANALSSHATTGQVRLVPFERTSTDSYVLEFSALLLRVYKDGALLPDLTDTGGAQPTIATPYAVDDLRDLKFAMDGNVVYITHPDFAPRLLTWAADADWEITTPTFTRGGSDAVWLDFGATGEYPRGVTIFESRLVVCGPTSEPQAVAGSKAPTTGTTNFTNFTQGTNASDAYFHAAGSATGYDALWVIGHSNNLLVGTNVGEAILFGDGATGITPLTPGAKFQSNYGSANIQGLLVNNRVMFVQQGGKRVRQLVFTGDANQYSAPDLTITADHITGDGIVEWSYQSNPYPLLWCVRSDGVMAVLSYDSDNGIQAWSRVVIPGDSAKVESVAVINGNTTEQQVWIATTRKVNDVDVRHIEVMQPRDWGTDDGKAFFLMDGGSGDNGASATITAITKATPPVVTAAAHGFLNGETIRITDAGGMTEVNGVVYKVADKTTNTFELQTNVAAPTDIIGAGVAEVFSVTCVADVSGSLSGTFFDCSSPTTDYRVWFDVSSGSTAPSLTGKTGVEVDITTNDSAATIGGLLRTALGNLADFASSGSSAEAIATATAVGACTDAIDGSTATGFTIITTTQGLNAFTTYTSGGTVEKVSQVVTGLTHLVESGTGATVSAQTDGYAQPEVQVSASGTATLQDWGNKHVVGLSYESIIEPVNLAVQAAGGIDTLMTEFIIQMYNSGNGGTVGVETNTMTELIFDFPDYYGTSQSYKTGEHREKIEGTWDKNSTMLIKQSNSLPLTILAIAPVFRPGGRR